jgi:hypothetical protein
MLANVRREQMQDHVAEVDHEPAFGRLSFHTTPFLKILFQRFQDSFCKRVEHAVTGTAADDKIICKGCNVFDVKKQDVFPLFVLQGFDDFMSKF